MIRGGKKKKSLTSQFVKLSQEEDLLGNVIDDLFFTGVLGGKRREGLGRREDCCNWQRYCGGLRRRRRRRLQRMGSGGRTWGGWWKDLGRVVEGPGRGVEGPGEGGGRTWEGGGRDMDEGTVFTKDTATCTV